MKRTIGKKLVFTYLILIGITLTVSGILFTAFIRDYMVTEAKDSLRMEANRLVELAGTGRTGELGPVRKQILIRLALHTIESNYFIVSRASQEVVESSSREVPPFMRSPIPLQRVFEGDALEGQGELRGKEIVFVALPIGKGGQVPYALVLFTELQKIRTVTYQVVMVLIKGFLITAILMLAMAYFMMRSLTRPLEHLQQAVARLAKRDFSPPEIVHTGDELEELSRAFRQMTLALKQYDEAQRRFLQNASHELKTPLMAIQGYAEGIRDGIFQGTEAEKGLDVISAESKRLKKMVDELIYLSKLETLDAIYDLQPVDLQMIAQESIERVESLAQQKGVYVSLQAAPIGRLLLDPDKMMQAFINLLANGIRHARSRVTLSIQNVGAAVRITVEDDGPGLREEHKEKIFERFFQGDGGDTGLGLAITRAIIEKSGGTIRADNGAAGGAVFTIEFPTERG
ncbi:sensor histidine kinase [Effusibacillus pohliae]|uniref:sensor histidine kinase n=1 Tax=Effusibacillus pohliae TaxID=232270 RepID=UPI00036F016D|nr:sensor histidine kinase [Effusibacillus pohliae]